VGRARVLDVGNCDPDHGAIRAMLVNHFDVDVDRVMFVEEAQAQLARQSYDLVLVNRRIFADDSDGMALVRSMRADSADRTPAMVVSNFAEAQEAAVAAGAEPGFGKAALGRPETIERLARYLPRKAT
jgi:DNA-binding response OmpR family regulator